MARFGKFLILALIGFGLGAGFAYFQQSQESVPGQQPLLTVEQASVDPVTGEIAPGDIVAGAPEMPVADETAMADTTPAAGADDAPVAGSSVGGAFALTDFNGNAVTEKSWPGKMKLVFFGFTNCPDICPVALDKMTTALNTLSTDKFQPLFITVDPERDNAEALKTYLGNYHASFIGLTGTPEALKEAQDSYKVYATKSPAAGEGHPADHYNVDHSGYIYLIGENEQLLEIFGSGDTTETMTAKLKPYADGTAGSATPPAEGVPAPEPAPFAANDAAPSTATDASPVMPEPATEEAASASEGTATETPAIEETPAP